MSVEVQFLLALYAIAVTVACGLMVYALIDAKRTLKLLGLAAEAKNAVAKCEETVKKTIAEAEEIIKKAEGKIKSAPKRPVARKPAAPQRKVVAPKK